MERFVKRYEQKRGRIEFVEEQHDGVFIQAFIGDYVPMSMPVDMYRNVGNKEGTGLRLSYLFRTGMALLPRLGRDISLKQFSRTGYVNPMITGETDVIRGKQVILEDMMCQ